MEKKRRKWFIAVVILLVLAVAFPVEEAVSQAEAVLEAAPVGAVFPVEEAFPETVISGRSETV